jgi:hypothetical protein
VAAAGIPNYRQRGDFDRLDVNHRTRDADSIPMSRLNVQSSPNRALQVPIPSREEQDEIVRRVESLFAYADRLEARYTTARRQVENLTPALLAKAFRGELVPQDPTDEPASALLERIRAARAAEASKPKHNKTGARAKMTQKGEANMLNRKDVQDDT